MMCGRPVPDIPIMVRRAGQRAEQVLRRPVEAGRGPAALLADPFGARAVDPERVWVAAEDGAE
eukprot:1999413-Amphidinium_carterae.1